MTRPTTTLLEADRTIAGFSRPPSRCGYPAGLCAFRRLSVKAYVIAYREAEKCGDDPADYIRDCVRGSRNLIEPWTQGGRPKDPLSSVDVKIALERVRDVHGIALTIWNVDRIAPLLCSEHWNADDR